MFVVPQKKKKKERKIYKLLSKLIYIQNDRKNILILSYFKQNAVMYFMTVLFILNQQKNNQHFPYEKNEGFIKTRHYLRLPFKNGIKSNFEKSSVNKPYIFNQIVHVFAFKKNKNF